MDGQWVWFGAVVLTGVIVCIWGFYYRLYRYDEERKDKTPERRARLEKYLRESGRRGHERVAGWLSLGALLVWAIVLIVRLL
jgi:cytochrome b